jgi:hypothetical protein
VNSPFAKLCAGLIACAVGMAAFPASARVLVHSGGFEAPGYSTTFAGTGRLAGQAATSISPATWQQSSVNGTAVVQSAVVRSGTQAVRVNRAANTDSRWAIAVPAQTDRFITIEWDMFVASSAAAGFGPFFGIEAYDSLGAVERIGMLGVDAATGEVLYGDQLVGLSTVPGVTAPQNAWNSFKIVIDFSTDLYYGYLNGTEVIATPLETANASEFTDADIAAVAAGADAASQARTGTAYFDNYLVRSGIRGDYNFDGVVDAADYTVWRDQRNTTGLLRAADGDFNGVVNDADYAIWASHYGAPQSLVNTATSVPEPSAAVLVILAAAYAAGRRP